MNENKVLNVDFFKEGNDFELVEIFNLLIENKLVKTKDNYSNNGEFLFLSVNDNKQSREILSEVIIDFESYKTQESVDYNSDKDELVLCHLYEVHKAVFDYDLRIVWDRESKKYTQFYALK